MMQTTDRHPLAATLNAARALVLRAALRSVKPKMPMLVSEWADKHRHLSSDDSREAGPWRTSRMPFLREIMDSLSEHVPCNRVSFMAPSQMGKTQVGVNWLGYIVDHAGGPTGIYMPSESSMEEWLLQKFEPMVEATEVVRKKLSPAVSRGGDNTKRSKKFVGGRLYFRFAGSTKDMKSTTFRYTLRDEIDEYGDDKHQGNKQDLIDRRQVRFAHDRKAYLPSTPTIAGMSAIEDEFKDGDQRYYYVPCPHCNEHQVLKLSNLHWESTRDKQTITRVWYVCEHNGCVIEEYSKAVMLPEEGYGGRAKWVPHEPKAVDRSYTINALYVPIGMGDTWSDIARQWMRSQDDKAKLKAFVNNILAEPWEDRDRAKLKPQGLMERAEPYSLRTVPPGCLLLTCGVDVQPDRLEGQILGFGPPPDGSRHEKTYTVDKFVLPGDPTRNEVWTALLGILTTPLPNAYGKQLYIQATAIDSGGHNSDDVYGFVRDHRSKVRRLMAIRGKNTPSKSVLSKPVAKDFNSRGKYVKYGIHLWEVGTETCKDTLYNRLISDTDTDPENRLIHFSEELEIDYYKQLLSEKKDPTKNRYVKRPGVRNEDLDTWGYARAAAHHPEISIHRMTKAAWAKLAAVLEPSAPQPVTETPTTPAAPPSPVRSRAARAPDALKRRAGGFVGKYRRD